jgi:hypothetical protein
VRRLLVLLSIFSLVAACTTDDGRTLSAPKPGATAPTTVPPAIVTTPGTLSLTSSAFGEGQLIPYQHSCKGSNLSPPLSWTAVPQAAVELAIVVRDSDANGFIHWIVAGLSRDLTGLSEGAVPEGAVIARNDFGTVGWSGPCPTTGVHHYVFSLHVLAEPLGLQPDTPAADAAQLIESGSLDVAQLTGTFAA